MINETTLKQEIVKTTKAKQKLWCYVSKQETISSGQERISLLENCALHGRVDGDGSSHSTIVLRNSLHEIQLPDSQITLPTIRISAKGVFENSHHQSRDIY